jgi:NADPH2:quinone reductase
MKAIVITQPGGPEVLQLADRPKPLIAPDEVLIKVMAAGINRPDVFNEREIIRRLPVLRRISRDWR